MYTVAFVGNPNVGKSAWINALTHADFKVGNWPGVTVEKKEAFVTWNQQDLHMIDLPGTYSLDKSDNEEYITGAYLAQEHVDLIVNVVDATNLRKNLLLTLLLRELQIPMVLIFNFMDEVEKYHIHLDIIKLSRRLQIQILPYSAYDFKHYEDVKQAILNALQTTPMYYPLLSQAHQADYVHLFNYAQQHLSNNLEDRVLHQYVMRYFKRDPLVEKQLLVWGLDDMVLQTVRKDLDTHQILTDYQHEITSLMHYVKEEEHKRYEVTKRIDHILLHNYMGLPIFFVIFTFMLLFVFQFSAPWNAFIDYVINDVLTRYLYVLLSHAPNILQRLLLDGVVAGVGGVLVFVPVMACLNFMLAILEESGYMARISFLLDRFMRIFHLSGKSFVSLLLGFGCNVPAIYATRTLDNEKQRRLTAILIPFMSCGARLPVYVLFASAFFPHQAGLMIVSVYGIGLFMALVFALLFSHVSFMKDDAMYVQELPIYRMPSMRVVLHKVKDEVRSYIKKALGIVLWAMIILWGVSYFPNGNMQSSYIAQASKFVQPLFEPLGFGTRWESVASLPGGIIAKETIVGYFEQVLNPHDSTILQRVNVKEDTSKIARRFVDAGKQSIVSLVHPQVQTKPSSSSQVSSIRSLWKDRFAKLRAFSFMVYVLLSIPCVMTLQALYHEYGWKLMLLSIFTMLFIPYLSALCIFQLFSRLTILML